MSDNKKDWPTVPISADTYHTMRKLGWCTVSKKGIVDLTPEGTAALITSLEALRAQNEEIRPEWLAPD